MKTSNEESTATLGRLGLAFLIFFFVFMLVGYFRGRAVKRGRDHLLPFVEERLQVGKDAEGIIIVYNCSKKPFYYYIDSNRIEDHNLASAIRREDSSDYMTSIFADDVLFKSFLGAGTAWTFKGVFSYVARAEREEMKGGAKLKYVAVVILGAVTGYSIGYAIGVSGEPDCDSSDMDALLRDEKNWKAWEKMMWQSARRRVTNYISTLLSTYRLSDHEKQKPQDQLIKDAMKKLDEVDRRAVIEGYDFKTADFDVLVELNKAKETYMDVYKAQSDALPK